jgi:hypothetical protein
VVASSRSSGKGEKSCFHSSIFSSDSHIVFP